MPDLFYLYIFGNFVFLLLILFIFNFFYRLDWYTIFWGSLLGFYIVLLNMGAKFSVTAVAVIILSAGLVAVIRQNMECGRQNSRLYISFFVGLFITLGIGKYVLTF